MSSSLVTNKMALIMGVANKRSIAWSCVETLAANGWKVAFSYQNEKMASRVEPLLQLPNVVTGFPCDVQVDMDNSEFAQRLADFLQEEPLDTVVHSLAHAPNLKTTPLLQTTQQDFAHAHEVSAYSLILIAKQTQPFLQKSNLSPSITALTYLGATRAIPGYNVMGPAKASLESIVRGLALELARPVALEDSGITQPPIRVNAVSAGPIATLSAKGGIAEFGRMREEMEAKAPLGNITAEQVAATVQFLSTEAASGITGQTIHVDGGYSIVGGPSPS